MEPWIEAWIIMISHVPWKSFFLFILLVFDVVCQYVFILLSCCDFLCFFPLRFSKFYFVAWNRYHIVILLDRFVCVDAVRALLVITKCTELTCLIWVFVHAHVCVCVCVTSSKISNNGHLDHLLCKHSFR